MMYWFLVVHPDKFFALEQQTDLSWNFALSFCSPPIFQWFCSKFDSLSYLLVRYFNQNFEFLMPCILYEQSYSYWMRAQTRHNNHIHCIMHCRPFYSIRRENVKWSNARATTLYPFWKKNSTELFRWGNSGPTYKIKQHWSA